MATRAIDTDMAKDEQYRQTVKCYADLLDAMRNFEANPNYPGTFSFKDLATKLLRYEATGDHDHGWDRPRPIPAGACPECGGHFYHADGCAESDACVLGERCEGCNRCGVEIGGTLRRW